MSKISFEGIGEVAVTFPTGWLTAVPTVLSDT